MSKSSDEVYLPLLRERRKVRRQLKWIIEPLFPCYLFARFTSHNNFCTACNTPGIVGVVNTSEDGPTAVDERTIIALRERSLNGYIEVESAQLLPGAELEIIEGPFQGLKALFQQELKAGERVVVLLELLSSQVRVELPSPYVQTIRGI